MQALSVPDDGYSINASCSLSTFILTLLYALSIRSTVALFENESNLLMNYKAEKLMSSPVFSGVRVTRSLVLCVLFYTSLFVILSFFFWSLCCLYLRFTDYDQPFAIFKHFLQSFTHWYIFFNFLFVFLSTTFNDNHQLKHPIHHLHISDYDSKIIYFAEFIFLEHGQNHPPFMQNSK